MECGTDASWRQHAALRRTPHVGPRFPRRQVSGADLRYTLIGSDGQPYRSPLPGAFGGYRRSRIFGRLDCPSALRAIARGGYVSNRVFFTDAATATSAGYRPCAVCMPEAHAEWKRTDRL